MKFPGSKLAIVALVGVLLAEVVAWVGARPPAATSGNPPQPPAPAHASQVGGAQRGSTANALAPSRPQSTTRTRAS